MTMMLVRGRCRLLVVVKIDVSDACDDGSTAADVGEGDLTLLLDVSSPLLLHLLQDVMMMTYVVVVVVVVVS